MPELPEVEAARRALQDSCCGRTILDATIAEDAIVVNGVTPSALRSALTGRTILNALRKGKNLWLQLDHRPWPTFQFGMTGAFYIKGKEITKYKRSAVSDEEEWPSKFSKVFLKLDDGLEVSFTDKRRLARVRLIDDPLTAPPVSELGPDAFLELPDEITFTGSILKKKCPIKALLLDQSFIAGIGNWLADEILYQARIHPEQVAASLSEDDCIELHKCIQKVINLSVEVNADSERFPKDWIFHYRWNKKPGEVAGKKIEFITVGGRTSAIVPALQNCTSISSKKANGNGWKLEKKLDDKGKKGRSKTEQVLPAKSSKASEKKGKQTKASDSADVAETSEESVELEVRSKRSQKKGKPANKNGGMAKSEDNETVQSTKKRGRPPARKQEEKHGTNENSNGKEGEATPREEDKEMGNKRAARKRSAKNVGTMPSSPVGTAEVEKQAQGRKRKLTS